MPIYNYRCPVCGAQKEILTLKIHPGHPPVCCGEKMKKVIGLAVAIFRGKGFSKQSDASRLKYEGK